MLILIHWYEYIFVSYALPPMLLSRWSGLPFPSPMHESEKRKWSRSVVSDSWTPWTAAHQAPPSIGFSRQEYWSGMPLPSLYMLLGKYKLKQHEIFFYNNHEHQKVYLRICNMKKLEKEMATHSSVLAWRIPGTGEPGGLPSMESHRESDTTEATWQQQ